MKKIFTLSIAVLVSVMALCQFSFNIQGGGHLTIGTFGDKQADPGLQGGVSFNIPVSHQLFLQPGIIVMRHSWKGYASERSPLPGTTPAPKKIIVANTDLKLSLRVLYKFREQKNKWYAGAGADYHYLVNEGVSSAVSFSVSGGYYLAKRWFVQGDFSPVFIYEDDYHNPYESNLTELHQQFFLSIGFRVGKLG
ncbi:hypothetical protein [Terrimonas alba]|uniref:hypothetical protein n=1 Tax=Terrimonas alba TaxID=3349636 RepID=UPI0035F2A1F7